MRSRPTSITLTTNFHATDRPESSYQRQSLRTARHRMELIGMLMLVLAAMLAGWSVHQSYAWHARIGTALTEAGTNAEIGRDTVDHNWLRAQRWPHDAQPIQSQQETAADRGQWTRFSAPERKAANGIVEILPRARQDIGRSPAAHLPNHNSTSSDYLLAAGVFLLALLCCLGSLRRAAATTQMTALLAAELFTLIGVGFLSALPAAL